MAISEIMELVIRYNQDLLEDEPVMTFVEMAGIMGYERKE